MQKFKLSILRYLGLIGIVMILGWVIWQQHLLHSQLELFELHLTQLTAHVEHAKQPSSQRDEIKHYQQLAQLMLDKPSDLDLGTAYLDILIKLYAEQQTFSQIQPIRQLQQQIQALKDQVMDKLKLINQLQLDLLTPSHQEVSWTPNWLVPWRDWVKLEISQNPSNEIDPQRWRYWSTLELAKWYLVHGHFDEFKHTIAYLAKWVHVYPAELAWTEALDVLLEPMPKLDLSVLKAPVYDAVISPKSRQSHPSAPASTSSDQQSSKQTVPQQVTQSEKRISEVLV